MDRKAFERLAEEAVALLPRRFRKRIENLYVVVEDWPTREDLESVGLSTPHDLLGLYHGIPLDERGMGYGNVLPDRVSIYQGPIEAICETDEEVREEIRLTIIHELGHYFGLSDAEMAELEEAGPEEFEDGR